MERDKSFDVIAILAIILSVIGLTLGFAAYTSNLTVVDSNATISAADEQTDFQNKIYWTSGPDTDIFTGDHSASITFPSKELDKTTGDVTYVANVTNESNYIAYMKSVSASGGLVCSATDQDADISAINSFCSQLSLKVTFDGTDVTGSVISGSTTLGDNLNTLATPLSVEAITGVKKIIITLKVSDNVVYPENNVTVSLPTITFNYSTAK